MVLNQNKPNIKKLNAGTIKSVLKNLWRIDREIIKDRPFHFWVYSFCNILTPIISVGQTWVLSILINYIASGNISFQYLYLLTGVNLFMTVFPFLFSRIENYFGMVITESLYKIFNIKRAAKMAEIDMATHESPEFNDLNNKVSEGGAMRLVEMFDQQNRIIVSLISVLTATVIIISFKWWLLLAIFIAVTPSLIANMYYGRATYKLHSNQTSSRRELNLYRNFFYDLPNIIDIKIYHLKESFLKKFEIFYLKNSKERIQFVSKRAGWESLSYFIAYIGIAVPIAWFIKQAALKAIAIGTLTFALSAIERLRGSLSSALGDLGKLYENNLYINDFFKLLTLDSVIKDTNTGMELKDNPQTIEFKNVSFAYSNDKKLVLKHINLTINAGEHLAIVGMNGAGKTTLVRLLCRFYDPTEGEILVDGHNLKNINLDSWYSYLGLLPQDYASYQLTVKEAIAVGRSDDNLDMEKVRKAAKMSEADKFIEEYPDKYDQRLGKTFHNGRELSIGEWQKLAIARLFYRNPYIYILDEPTSSVDVESEIKIFECLNKVAKDKIVIFISHRFTTLRQANKICVIEKGIITESGTHEELMAHNKTYTRLFNLQAKSYDN